MRRAQFTHFHPDWRAAPRKEYILRFLRWDSNSQTRQVSGSNAFNQQASDVLQTRPCKS